MILRIPSMLATCFGDVGYPSERSAARLYEYSLTCATSVNKNNPSIEPRHHLLSFLSGNLDEVRLSSLRTGSYPAFFKIHHSGRHFEVPAYRFVISSHFSYPV